MNTATKYSLVLWDFDGTLADSKEDVWASLVFAAAQFGGTFPRSYLANPKNLSDPMDVILRRVEPYPGEDNFAEFESLVRVHYRSQNDFANTELFPGIKPLLGELLLLEIPGVVVTVKPHEALRRILTMKGWDTYFDGLLSPDSEDSKEKTKTEMIASVLRSRAARPSECVYVGDSRGDAVAAKANGVDFVAVTYGDGDEMELRAEHPLHCFDNAWDLRSVLTEWK